MLRDARRLVVGELNASYSALEFRSPILRCGLHQGSNVATDFGLVERAAPFTHLLRTPSLSILLEGEGRFEESGRRAWLKAGDAVLSHTARGGTEAYAGPSSVWLVLEWEPDALGAPMSSPFAILHLRERERARLFELTRRLSTHPNVGVVLASVFDVLRAHGIPFERATPGDLDEHSDEGEQRLISALAAQLSQLQRQPAIQDLVDATGWNERLVHRRLAAVTARYRLPWSHWRGALHMVRLATVFRLLAAPGARTELVARLAGFRSPTGLCHMLADAGLPSPGVLARAARRDVLDAWSGYAGVITHTDHAEDERETA